MNISVVSASAGSGKTYRLTEILYERIADRLVEPEQVVAVTFTRAAAGELQERVRSKLFEKGLSDAGHAIQGALIGTVHSVCERLLRRFAFEAGLPPAFEVLPEEDTDLVFAQALSNALTTERHAVLTEVGHRFQVEDPRQDIRRVADAARANVISADSLRGMADDSVRSFLSVLDDPYWSTPEEADEECLETVATTVEALKAHVEAGEDPTKKTFGVLEFLERFESALANGGALWKDWAKLDPPDVGTKSREIVEALAEVGARQLGHPALHQDIDHYIRTVFATSADALEQYAEWKETRRLIDFTDMEARALELLQDRQIATALGEDFNLLLVDEFQDTNPIQLALFNRLGEVVGDVVWVGDRKQSIFGFRGSDPELMETAYLSHLGESDPEILETSYRSRPKLVDFCNQVFEKTFGDRRTVHLEADREERSELSEAIECWMLDSENLDVDAELLAEGVQSLLDPEAPAMVEDPVSKEVRPVVPGDIAILRRTNARCAAIAGSLADIGLPASVAENGLTQTLEITFLLAALEIVLDGYASLPAATIVHLSTGGDAVGLVEDRVRAMVDDEAGRLDPWSDHPTVSSLRELSGEVDELSATTLLDRTIRVSGVRDLCARWGNEAVRLANVEKVRGLATQYEARCALYAIGTTGGGLLSYLRGLEDGGAQAGDASSNAVHVTTYHKAKGKEWPVVILGDLDPQLPRWCASMGVEVHSGGGTFDPTDPLADRQIRFWPWPYGLTTTGAPLHTRVQATDEEWEAATKEDREAQRLLYVGFTRARDVLVLATRIKQPAPRLVTNLDAELSFPVDVPNGVGDVELMPGILIPARVRRLGIDARMAAKERTHGLAWFDRPTGDSYQRLPLYLAASALGDEPAVAVADVIELGDRLDFRSASATETALGDAFHRFVAADDPIHLSPHTRLRLAQRYCDAYGLDTSLLPASFVCASGRLWSYVGAEMPDFELERELPVQFRRDGQIVRGVIDFLASRGEQMVLVDHKTFAGGTATVIERTRTEFGPQIQIYARAIEESFGVRVKERFVHLPASGCLVPLG